MIRRLLLITLLGLSACHERPDSPRGFSLPKGDVNNGKQVFLQYKCLACHTLQGVEDHSLDKQLDTVVTLGGEVTKVKTYAELLTAIINPSHKTPLGYEKQALLAQGKSKMKVYNDVMTVSELVDLVAFLQIQYEVKPEQYTHYNIYHIP